MKNQPTSSSQAKKRSVNALRICKGLFATDTNKSVAKRIWQLVSRFTWELPQTLIGWLYAELRNMVGTIDRVDFIGGATYVINENWHKCGTQGVSLGNFINIDRDNIIFEDEETGSFKDFIANSHIFMHEYGHYLQSQSWGTLYLFVMGMPSLINAIYDIAFEKYSHGTFYTETSANRYAKGYFQKNYDAVWNEKWYPLDKNNTHID